MNNNFSENLKKIRKDNNLSQEQLAEELGVSRQAISKWESAVAYPEMDKIIALCDKFNLNIDDLLHKDIREVKGEEESKKNLNKYIDDFLKFITDTINLFSNMNFKSKIKCLFEQTIIICVLLTLALIIYGVGNHIVSSLLGFLPMEVYRIIGSMLECIYLVFIIIVAIIIWVHIFKTRYLDYYDKLKRDVMDNKDNIYNQKEEKSEEIIQDTNHENKILFKKNENKIIIRDPKHSEYRFINGLSKLVVGVIKFFALCFSLLLCAILIGLFCLFAMSFLITKTGIFFIGVLGAIISSGIVDIVLILIIFNFVFNRKNDKKKMIWSFIVSLIVFGISCGIIFVGSLKFDIIEDNKDMLITKTEEFDMNKDLFFNPYQSDVIDYVESDISNVKIEYKINKYCELESTDYYKNGVHVWGYCPNPTKLIREFISSLNDNKIITIDDEIKEITVYASKENIEIMKSNIKKFEEKQKQYENSLNEYEKEISHYQEQLDKDSNKFEEYENKIYELEEKIRILESQYDNE